MMFDWLAQKVAFAKLPRQSNLQAGLQTAVLLMDTKLRCLLRQSKMLAPSLA
jgi:hypothetical protein